MKFNWDEFMNKENKIAVHCKTEEEAIDFCRQMAKHGMKWSSGNSYYSKSNWNVYGKEIAYSNYGEYATYNFYKDRGHKILEWSNYMIKDPIDYLEYGYVVEFENGELGMYMPSQNGDCFVLYPGGYSCEYLKYFKDINNLKHDNKECNIFRIYGYSKFGWDSTNISIKYRPIIWERPKKVKKMTVSEICKELGCKIEIVEG